MLVLMPLLFYHKNNKRDGHVFLLFFFVIDTIIHAFLAKTII